MNQEHEHAANFHEENKAWNKLLSSAYDYMMPLLPRIHLVDDELLLLQLILHKEAEIKKKVKTPALQNKVGFPPFRKKNKST